MNETPLKALVIVPTYNEAENIVELVDEINRHAPRVDILVVDDQSPDGTPDLVREKQKTTPNLRLMVRTGQRGRGKAGIDGFRYGLEHGYEAIFEMDADFSHHPRYLPDFLREIRTADIVQGSRFVPGGDDSDRGWSRTLITKLASAYIRFVLRIDIRDCTSGYRCFRREVLEAINIENTVSLGPAIVQELLYKALLMGFRVREVPIVFIDRRRGKSTFSWKVMAQGVLMVLILRFLFSDIRESEPPIDA